jgi:phosphoribosyl 1,2-cyclic phosphate phosphodiesterase
LTYSSDWNSTRIDESRNEQLKLTFLGTSSSEGYPNAFCACENCQRARRLGGKNLRKRPAALIDDWLLIDFGPDLAAASADHDIPLTKISACLLTHEHYDHLDATNFFSRRPGSSITENPPMAFYATAGALEAVSGRIGGLSAENLARLNLAVHAIAPGDTFAVGPYSVTAMPSTHGDGIVPLLFAISGDDRSLLYATDTGPLREAAWDILRAGGFRFDVVALDHSFGFGKPSPVHLNAEEFLQQVTRLREEGLLAENARIFAHHLGHYSNPDHETFVGIAAELGYEVAYDGLAIEW